jgi:hypothetical protein
MFPVFLRMQTSDLMLGGGVCRFRRAGVLCPQNTA